MRLQFEMFSDALELEIKLDRIVGARVHRDSVAPGYFDNGEVSIRRWVDWEAINASFFERLTAQVKRCGVQIEQVREGKLLAFGLSVIALPFGSGASHSTVGESEMGNDFF